jgi:hypothetical protein
MKQSDSVREQVLSLVKDTRLIAMLMRLQETWGDLAFDVVDHWDANLHCVGVAQKRNHSILVSIDNFGHSNETYDVELESPPLAGSDQPFKALASFKKVTFKELSGLVGNHLELGDATSELGTKNQNRKQDGR